AGLEMDYKKRPQSVDDFLSLLEKLGKPGVSPSFAPPPTPQPLAISPTPSQLSTVGKEVGKRFGRVAGALSGVLGGLATGIVAGLLIIFLSAIIGAIACALGLAIAGAKEESCGTVLVGLFFGAVIGYYIGFYIGLLLAAGATIGGLVYGGISGVRLGSRVGLKLGRTKGALPTTVLFSLVTSALLGLCWMGFVSYVHPTAWGSALMFAGFVTIIGLLLGVSLGLGLFWFTMKRYGGGIPPKDKIIALLTIPIGVGIAYIIYYYAPHPQHMWLSHWVNWDSIIYDWKWKINELIAHGKKFFRIE
ncbi:MAG: hypothetical protein ACPLPS_09965, partial [bacterium]